MKHSKNIFYYILVYLLILMMGCSSTTKNTEKNLSIVPSNEAPPKVDMVNENSLAVQQLENYLRSPFIPEKLQKLSATAAWADRVWDTFGDRKSKTG